MSTAQAPIVYKRAIGGAHVALLLEHPRRVWFLRAANNREVSLLADRDGRLVGYYIPPKASEN